MLQELDKDLRDIETTLSNIAREYPQIARDAAQARYDYEMASAQATWDIDHRALAEGEKKPTIPAIEAEVTLKVADEKLKTRMTEAELDIARKLIANLESRLSSTQSRAKLSLIERGLVNG